MYWQGRKKGDDYSILAFFAFSPRAQDSSRIKRVNLCEMRFVPLGTLSVVVNWLLWRATCMQ